VAGTVSRPWLAGWVLGCAALAAAAAWLLTGPAAAAVLVGALAAGLLAGEAVRARAAARLGGVTGDVMGAMGEAATTVVLMVAAASMP
jgi:adenosylcobinamide-GDP ribazoletransferase